MQRLLSGNRDFRIIVSADGQASARGPGREISLGALGADTQAALQGLFDRPATELALADAVLKSGGAQALPTFYLLLHRLKFNGVIGECLACGEMHISSLYRAGGETASNPGGVDPDQQFVLSRFALLRNRGSQLMVESPLANGYFVLHSQSAAAAIQELVSGPRSGRELSRNVPGFCGEMAQAFLTAGAALQLFVQPEFEADPRLKLWDFHDLYFHSRSRSGRHANPYGGTFRAQTGVAMTRDTAGTSARATSTPMTACLIDLPRPDLRKSSCADPSLTAVLEARRSIRQFSEQPLQVEQVGEFLYRTFRIKPFSTAEGHSFFARPYPSGGALYELELYALVDRCEGLDRGLYQYLGDEHQLCKLASRPELLEAFLQQSQFTLNNEGRPQVLFLLSARFGKLAAKYESVAYALILKHVGVVYQTMYLVGTAMGLGCCAMGGGNSDLFAEATGLDYFTEGSVGEFAIGRRREEDEAIATPVIF